MKDKSTAEMTSNTPSNRYLTRILSVSDIDSRLVSAWDDLEARALHPNPFLSPYFVLPALKYLEPSQDCFGVFVEKLSAGSRDLAGAAWFRICKPARRFPLKHLAAFESVHSYLTDFLLDQEHASNTLKEIFGYLTNTSHAWHGLYLNNYSADGLLTQETQASAADFGMRWHLFSQWPRAVLFSNTFGDAALSHLSKGQKKNYQKNLRKLEELGNVKWVLTRKTVSLQKKIDDFVRLEHSGWKGDEGTSLYSDPNHLRFFYEMMEGFNKAGRGVFTELILNNKNISSTTNLISGKAGFAFKVGWDIEYAKYAPGIVNEIKTLENGHEFISDLEYIDSSAAPDSYINGLWPGRRDICEGMFSLTPLGRVALTGLGLARKLKSSLLSPQNQVSSKSS
jgi:hypothetical protein